MESNTHFQRYAQGRQRGIERMAEVQRQIDAWLDAHEQAAPSLLDLAQLEALHARREEVAGELERTENAFLEHLIGRSTEEGSSA